MAKEYDNTNRGALFRNKDKESDDHPDYTGKLNVLGLDYWLSAWLKTSKAGMKYMSLAVKPAEQNAPQKQTKQAPQEDEEIPF